MAKKIEGKEEIVEQSPKETPSEVTPPEVEPPSYSQEEVDTQIKEKLNEQYSKLNKRLTRLGEENKRLRNHPQAPQQAGQLNILKAQAAELKRQSTEQGVVSPGIAQIEAQIIQEESRLQEETTNQYREAMISDHRDEVEATLGDMGLTMDSDEAKSVKAAFGRGTENGDFSRMYYHLGKVKSKEAEPTPKPTEEQVQVAARKLLEKTPGFKTHEGEPSGGSRQNYTMAEFRARETEIRSLPSGERAAARKELKNAFNEGRVT